MTAADLLSEFDQNGFIRLQGAFSPKDAALMQEVIWDTLGALHDIRRDDRGSWQLPLATGLQAIRDHPVFSPVGAPSLTAFLDALLGYEKWQPPKHWGQFLVSLPDKEIRSRPNWHTDFPYTLPLNKQSGAVVFSLLSDATTGSGSTLALAGSHIVIEEFVRQTPATLTQTMAETRKLFLDSHPWLSALSTDWTEEDWVAGMVGKTALVDNSRVEIVELTGKPGDIIVAHPWLLHSTSPNRSDSPRFARVQRINLK